MYPTTVDLSANRMRYKPTSVADDRMMIFLSLIQFIPVSPYLAHVCIGMWTCEVLACPKKDMPTQQNNRAFNFFIAFSFMVEVLSPSVLGDGN